MREYGQIQCSYWRHPDIRALAGHAREFGAYLLTGPHSNGIGCYYLPDGYVNADLGWPAKTIAEGFTELSRIGFAYRCETTFFVLIPDFLKWNEVANPNVARARVREFDSVPRKSTIYERLCESLKRFGKHWPKDFEAVLDGSRQQEPTRTERNREDPEKKDARENAGASSTKGEKRVHGTPEDEALAQRIFAKVREVSPSAKEPGGAGWANCIRLMREQDGHSHDEIWSLFEWANSQRTPRGGGDFCWGAVILSPANLRAHWARLEAQRGQQGGGRASGAGGQDYGESGRI